MAGAFVAEEWLPAWGNSRIPSADVSTTAEELQLIQEVRRRDKVVRIFPNDESAWRLLGAFLAETHEDWSTGRRYFRMDEYFRWKQQQQAAEEEIQPAA